MRAIAGLVVFVCAVAITVGVLAGKPQATPDGFIYAWLAAQDAGDNPQTADAAARSYYTKTPIYQLSRYRALIDRRTESLQIYARPFYNRPLYPFAASMLLKPFGFRALFVVSALSYVAFGVVLFLLLSEFGRPWVAACLSLAALVLPISRGLGANDLTDMFAMVWWTMALLAILRLLRARSVSMLVILAIASIAFDLARPTPYAIVIPAAVLGLLRRYWLPLLASCTGVLAFGIETLLAPSIGLLEQIRWEYLHQPPTNERLTFSAWYLSSLIRSAHYTISESVHTVGPALSIAAGIYSASATRYRDEMILLFSAMIACLLALVANPIEWSIARVVAFPMVPIFGCMLQAGVCTLFPVDSRSLTNSLKGRNRVTQGAP